MSHKIDSKEQNVRSSLPYPDTPGIGPDTPDPIARSDRVTVSRLKNRFARCFRAYTRSFQVTLRPMASFGLRGINIPPHPFSQLSCPFDKLNTLPSLERALSLPFLHSWVIPWRDLSEKQAKARIRVSEPHSHLLSTWFWSSPRIQVCYSWSLELLDG